MRFQTMLIYYKRLLMDSQINNSNYMIKINN